ncbi:hypothetical protein [Enhygromyxa salina]|uniref:hypothetical protein n=1 Tax=Enhygromyxa salina TaxID=215803 RepID=UPI0011B1EECD|nr:hypothetical protein [Enhygromyxa salina]
MGDEFGTRFEVVSGALGDELRVLVAHEQCSSGASSPTVGWHVFQGHSGGLDLTSDVLECEEQIGTPMSTARWGDLEQLARVHAVRISREASP